MKTMKNLMRAFSLCLVAITLCNCHFDDDHDGGIFNCIDGEGDVETVELDLDDFNEIKLKTSADVYLTQGPDQEVLVEGEDNVIDELDLDVDDDRWDIEFDKCIDDHEDLKIYITMPDIRKLIISGSGQIVTETVFTVDDLELVISGSGDFDLELECDDIEAKISGSGDIELEGTCDDIELEISGSGEYQGFDMECSTADVKISGSGDVEILVNDELDVRISGSGDVYYKGNPDLDINISGSGEVIDAN